MHERVREFCRAADPVVTALDLETLSVHNRGVCPGFRDRLSDRDRERVIRLALRRVALRPGGGGTLLTEPVVVWYGSYRGDYEALNPQRRLLAAAKGFPAAEGYQHRYELSDADQRAVLEILVSDQSARRPHAIVARDGNLIATVTLTGTRRPVQQPVLAGNALIGNVHERRGVLRDLPMTVSDPSGRQAAVCRTCARDSFRVAYVVEIDDVATPALRSVAVAAAILNDWTHGMYEPGG